MHGDDMEIVASPVVTHGHIERSVRLHQCHEQALRKRSGAWPLLNDLTLVKDPESLLSGDAALVGPEQRMVAPLDAAAPRCSSNGGKSEHPTCEGVMDGKPQSV